MNDRSTEKFLVHTPGRTFPQVSGLIERRPGRVLHSGSPGRCTGDRRVVHGCVEVLPRLARSLWITAPGHVDRGPGKRLRSSPGRCARLCRWRCRWRCRWLLLLSLLSHPSLTRRPREHRRAGPARLPRAAGGGLGRRSGGLRAGAAPVASRRPHAAAGQRRRAERPRRDAAVQGRHRRRLRDRPRRRLLPARARGHPRRDHRPLRPRRAGRPGHRRRRAPAPRRAGPHRRGALPPHPLGQRADRGQRRLLRRDRPREGHPAPPRRRRHQDRPARLRRRGPGRRRRRPGAGRGLQDHRQARVGRLRPAVRHHGRRPRRDRGDRQPRGRACTACPPGSPTSTT